MQEFIRLTLKSNLGQYWVLSVQTELEKPLLCEQYADYMIAKDSINRVKPGGSRLVTCRTSSLGRRITVNHALKSIAMMRDDSVDVESLIQTVGLSSKSDQMLDNLSQGMRQRLSLACALIGNPKLLVMDEPLNGLDPLAQRAFSNLLKNLAKKGVAVVISSHQVADLETLVDEIALLHQGQLLIEGSLAKVRKDLGLEDNSGIVEMICSATGIDPYDFSLELSRDIMLPLKSLGGEEE